MKLNNVCNQPTNKPEVLFPDFGVLKLAAKKEWLPKDFQSSCNPECLIRFSPNLPVRNKMRSGYARLHTMQSCVPCLLSASHMYLQTHTHSSGVPIWAEWGVMVAVWRLFGACWFFHVADHILYTTAAAYWSTPFIISGFLQLFQLKSYSMLLSSP